MTEAAICGRGGQGGVTLAKLIATSYFLQGNDVHAFVEAAGKKNHTRPVGNQNQKMELILSDTPFDVDYFHCVKYSTEIDIA